MLVWKTRKLDTNWSEIMESNVAYLTFNKQEIMMESLGMIPIQVLESTPFQDIINLCKKENYELIFVSPNVYRKFESLFMTTKNIRVVVLDNTEIPSHLGQKRMKELMETSIGIQIR